MHSSPLCHSESALAVPIYAALHLVIPNPLQRCQYTRLCTLSFRIRFSGEESDLIETDSCQGTPSRLPPRAHPASSRPSGATATARSSALPLIKIRQRMAKEPLSRTPSSAVRNFGDMLTPAFRNRPETSDF